MEGPGQEIVLVTVDEILNANRRLIDSSGGRFVPPDNILNRDALEYILAAISTPFWGQDLYPTMKEKAAALAHQVITRHVFTDGNKRTAVHVAWSFLRGNEVPIVYDDTIIDMAADVASGDADYPELLAWFHEHQDESLTF